MLTAVQEEQRAEHRQRARSGASGPVFSVPLLAGGFELQPVAASAVTSCPAAAVAAPAAAASAPGVELSALLGRSVGSGQCVALVRAAHPALGPSSTWAAGAPVQLVLDQWAGSSAAVRTIPWSNPGGVAANTGAAFRVVRAG